MDGCGLYRLSEEVKVEELCVHVGVYGSCV